MAAIICDMHWTGHIRILYNNWPSSLLPLTCKAVWGRRECKVTVASSGLRHALGPQFTLTLRCACPQRNIETAIRCVAARQKDNHTFQLLPPLSQVPAQQHLTTSCHTSSRLQSNISIPKKGGEHQETSQQWLKQTQMRKMICSNVRQDRMLIRR